MTNLDQSLTSLSVHTFSGAMNSPGLVEATTPTFKSKMGGLVNVCKNAALMGTLALGVVVASPAQAQQVEQKSETKSSLFKVLGAVAGGVLGSQFGEGTGKQLATIGGAILGGVAVDKILTDRANDTAAVINPETGKLVSGDNNPCFQQFRGETQGQLSLASNPLVNEAMLKAQSQLVQHYTNYQNSLRIYQEAQERQRWAVTPQDKEKTARNVATMGNVVTQADANYVDQGVQQFKQTCFLAAERGYDVTSYAVNQQYLVSPSANNFVYNGGKQIDDPVPGVQGAIPVGQVITADSSKPRMK